jgi:hypothetical protein
MSAVAPATPAPATPSTGPTPAALEAEINTGAAIASGIAAVTPAAPIAVPAIDAAATIADLILQMTSMYGQKVITAQQLNAMVKIAVSGFSAAVAEWNAAK